MYSVYLINLNMLTFDIYIFNYFTYIHLPNYVSFFLFRQHCSCYCVDKLNIAQKPGLNTQLIQIHSMNSIQNKKNFYIDLSILFFFNLYDNELRQRVCFFFFSSPVVRRLSVRPSINFLYFHLLQNYLANFNQTLHKVYMDKVDSSVFK